MRPLDPEIEKLLEQLGRREESLRAISDKTGLGWHWLRAFSERRIQHPGYQKVQALKGYLDKKSKRSSSDSG